ncbi:hypothetical protein VCHA53O466_40320 [Vibrio chagasii]|nr:hypothetical protein VCHA53O466_40320 [Vibrio chagasii]
MDRNMWFLNKFKAKAKRLHKILCEYTNRTCECLTRDIVTASLNKHYTLIDSAKPHQFGVKYRSFKAHHNTLRSEAPNTKRVRCADYLAIKELLEFSACPNCHSCSGGVGDALIYEILEELTGVSTHLSLPSCDHQPALHSDFLKYSGVLFDSCLERAFTSSLDIHGIGTDRDVGGYWFTGSMSAANIRFGLIDRGVDPDLIKVVSGARGDKLSNEYYYPHALLEAFCNLMSAKGDYTEAEVGGYSIVLSILLQAVDEVNVIDLESLKDVDIALSYFDSHQDPNVLYALCEAFPVLNEDSFESESSIQSIWTDVFGEILNLGVRVKDYFGSNGIKICECKNTHIVVECRDSKLFSLIFDSFNMASFKYFDSISLMEKPFVHKPLFLDCNRAPNFRTPFTLPASGQNAYSSISAFYSKGTYLKAPLSDVRPAVRRCFTYVLSCVHSDSQVANEILSEINSMELEDSRDKLVLFL